MSLVYENPSYPRRPCSLACIFRELEKIYFQLENGTYTQQEPDTRYIENGISEYIQDFGASKHITKTIKQFDGSLRATNFARPHQEFFRYKLTDKSRNKF